MNLDLKGKVVTVRPEETITTKQNLPYYVGISRDRRRKRIIHEPGGDPTWQLTQSALP
jgi:hypothetical protein